MIFDNVIINKENFIKSPKESQAFHLMKYQFHKDALPFLTH